MEEVEKLGIAIAEEIGNGVTFRGCQKKDGKIHSYVFLDGSSETSSIKDGSSETDSTFCSEILEFEAVKESLIRLRERYKCPLPIF